MRSAPHLASNHVIAFDTETALIRPGRLAPELTCLTYQHAGQEPEIMHAKDCLATFRLWLESPVVLVGHNVAFDLAVMGAEYPELVPAIFAKYDADQVTDTMLRQQLLDIAAGRFRVHEVKPGVWVKVNYTLFDVAKRHTDMVLKKDTWRMFYGHFRDVPIAEWPAHALIVKDLYRPALAALLADPERDKKITAHLVGMVGSDPGDVVKYPLDDARATMGCFIGQESHKGYLDDQFRQSRKAFWLHLVSAWGLRTDGPAVERLRQETEEARDDVKGRLVAAGLVREDGSRDTKAATKYMLSVCTGPIRLTDTGSKKWGDLDEAGRRAGIAEKMDGASLDEDACSAAGDDLLDDYSTYATLGTILSKDVPALARGAVFPIHTKFGIANTGRTTSSNPNVHNFSKRGGLRECFRPREGMVYAVADVDQLELRTLAQVCLVQLKTSRLAEVLNAGKDPHTEFAARVLGISYDDGMRLKEANDPAFDDVRQGCKFTNFALPGGVGAAKMVCIARGQGIKLGDTPEAELAKAKELKEQWFQMWPEMRLYFRFIESLEVDGLYNLKQLYTNRYRGGCRYTAAANSWFQGLGADGAGEAGWLITSACYTDRKSPLFGSRIVNHSHDDFVLETPDTPAAHDVAQELARLMIMGFGKYTPDVRMSVKPYLTTIWSKRAMPTYDASGRLIPWPAKPAQPAQPESGYHSLASH